MKQKNKFSIKFVLLAAAIIAIAVALFFYFSPISMSKLLNSEQSYYLTHIEFSIEDSAPIINSQDFSSEDTNMHKQELTTLLSQHFYNRTTGTLFSDGSMNDFGDELLHIFVYEETEFVNIISISSSGNIAVNGKNYTMTYAHELIEEIMQLMGSE